MNCILNILHYGAVIIETAVLNIASLCDCGGKKEAAGDIIVHRPVRIPRVVVMSAGRRSFAALAAALAKAGVFDNSSHHLAYANMAKDDGDSSDDSTTGNGFCLIGGRYDVGQRSVSADQINSGSYMVMF